MYELKWNDSYLIGNSEVDAEHKNLFAIAHKALTIVDPSQRKAKIKKMIQELYSYTKTHFSNEEAYMSSIKYPYLKEHMKIHEHIIGLINEFILKLSTMTIMEFEKELAFFVQTLIVNHITTEDKKITLWFAQQQQRKEFKAEASTKISKKTKGSSSIDEDLISLDDVS
ncbi:MAG: hemerythrin family protein [Campylobacterota bacterium]|nr:hemerythrin family protein [Campylobacterota bacterium]